MRFVSVRDLRGKSAEVWKRVSVDKEVVVTSNGRPIAILSAVNEEGLEESLAAIRRARAIQAVESMQAASRRAGLDQLSPEEIETEIKAVKRSHAK